MRVEIINFIRHANGKTSTQIYRPNRTATTIRRGQWYRLEFYVRRAGTQGGQDGVIRWWVDGVLQGELTGGIRDNYGLPFAMSRYGVSEWHGNPVRGNGNPAFSGAEYMSFDRIYMSGR